MELKKEKGVELNIDLEQDDDAIQKSINKMLDDLMEMDHQAIMKDIEANTIVLNEKYDYCKSFYHFGLSIKAIQPMILGKQVLMGTLPDKYDCAMLYSYKDENLLDLFRKYVKVSNGRLYFKGITRQKNWVDFEKIRRFIENEN